MRLVRSLTQTLRICKSHAPQQHRSPHQATSACYYRCGGHALNTRIVHGLLVLPGSCSLDSDPTGLYGGGQVHGTRA